MNETRPRNRKIASFGIPAAAMLISGCVVGPDFQKPDAPTPEGWLETAEASINTDASDHREWWKSFGDPALEALIERAYTENQALEIAGLRVYEARAQLGFAVGTLYPQTMSVRLSADDIELSKNAEPVSILPPPVRAAIDPEFSNYRLGFDAGWELDFWGRFRRIVEELSKFPGVSLAVSSSALRKGSLPDTHIYRSVINNFNSKRSGNVYVVFEPNRFINDFDGLTVAATHGSPWQYDTSVPIIFAGYGLSQAVIDRKVHTIDIAATLAAVCNIKVPSGSVGTPLIEVLTTNHSSK